MTKWIVAAVIGGIAVIAFSMWLFPSWNVWRAEKEGESELARAEQNRRVSVLEATAKRDAAKELAAAEVERAKGVAEANRIIADSLKGHDEYLRYLWIDKLSEGTQREVIYVPTEANIPILEAGKRGAAPESARP